MKNNLIMDIGMHKAYDTEFYLKKGFRVVAVEASAGLCEQVSTRLKEYLKNGCLTIVNKAIAPIDVKAVSFYINPRKDDWGSTHRITAEKGYDVAVETVVETTTLHALFDTYGVPYYLKSDIEGADPLLVRQLLVDSRRPTFISIETYSVADLNEIDLCGYDRYQVVNQWMHPFVILPNPALEGNTIDASFNGETSGPFGRDLPQHRWLNIGECRRRFSLWRELHDLDENLAPGWCDIHACNAVALEGC